MDAPKSPAGRPVVEDWSVESEIGSGGGGTVYVVRHHKTGDRAALKVPSAWGGGAEAAAELSALASMKHQHIVDLIGTIPTDQGDAILMEYLPGGSIADLVAARGPLTLGEAVTVIAPIASALAFLHEQGGTHGDVSPGNVLFTAAGMPKLADLGLAVLVGGRQSESGTPGFRAPQPAQDESGGRRLRPERDVYSLAALAWYMVTGRIAGPTQQRPPLSSLLGRVPGQLVELLEEGLSEDGQQRPTAAEFHRRIFEVAPPAPVSLRDAVRPEALGHMVTHVVSDQPGPRRGAWMRMRARAASRRDPQRPARRRLRGPRGGRRAGLSQGGPVPAPAAETRRWFRRPVAWSIGAAILVCTPLGALGVGELGHQHAGPPSAPAGTSPAVAAAGPARDRPGPGAVDQPGASSTAPPPGPVLEDRRFRQPVPEDPLAAAKVLSARRDLALAAADAAALRQVHTPHSSSLGPDLAKASQLRAQGLHYEGLSTRLSNASIRNGDVEGTVDVVVTSTIDAYQVVGADGAIVERIDDAQVQRVALRLAPTDTGWLIGGVLDASVTGKKAS